MVQQTETLGMNQLTNILIGPEEERGPWRNACLKGHRVDEGPKSPRLHSRWGRQLLFPLRIHSLCREYAGERIN